MIDTFWQACQLWLFTYLLIWLLLSLLLSYDVIGVKLHKLDTHFRLMNKGRRDAMIGFIWPFILIAAFIGRNKLKFGKDG